MSFTRHIAGNTVARMDAEYPPDPRGTILIRPGWRSLQRRRNPEEVFDFSKSQISPIYLCVLYNTFLCEKVNLWHREGPWHKMYGSNQRYDLRVRKRRRKAFREESKGSDSNGASRRGLFSDVDCSPRGYRVGNWVVNQAHYGPSNIGPRQGSLKRSLVPAPEDRMFFPTLIREDKHEEWRLLRGTRKSKVKILRDAQQKYYMDKLDKEEAEAEKLEEKTKPVIEARQSEDDTERKREDKETVESIKRMKLVIVEIDDTIKKMKQLAI